MPNSGGGGAGSGRSADIQTGITAAPVVVSGRKTDDSGVPIIPPMGGGEAKEAESALGRARRITSETAQTASNVRNAVRGIQEAPDTIANAIDTAQALPRQIGEAVDTARTRIGEAGTRIREGAGQLRSRLSAGPGGRRVTFFDDQGRIQQVETNPAGDMDQILSTDTGPRRWMPLSRPEEPLDPLGRRYTSSEPDLEQLPRPPDDTPRPMGAEAEAPTETTVPRPPSTFRSMEEPQEMQSIRDLDTPRSVLSTPRPSSYYASSYGADTPRDLPSARSVMGESTMSDSMPIGSRLLPESIRAGDMSALSDISSTWQPVDRVQPFDLSTAGEDLGTRTANMAYRAMQGDTAVQRFGANVASRARTLGQNIRGIFSRSTEPSMPRPPTVGLRSEMPYDAFRPPEQQPGMVEGGVGDGPVPSRAVEQMGIEDERLIPSRSIAVRSTEYPFTTSRPSLQWTGDDQIIRRSGGRSLRTLNPFRTTDQGSYTTTQPTMPTQVTPESASANLGISEPDLAPPVRQAPASGVLDEAELGGQEMADAEELGEVAVEAEEL